MRPNFDGANICIGTKKEQFSVNFTCDSWPENLKFIIIIIVYHHTYGWMLENIRMNVVCAHSVHGLLQSTSSVVGETN